MHFAWQFSVSFTCAASGRIFDGRNFSEKLLPSHTRVKYKPENDIQHSLGRQCKSQIPTISQASSKDYTVCATTPQRALAAMCCISALFLPPPVNATATATVVLFSLL
jgi:hypothetical protein